MDSMVFPTEHTLRVYFYGFPNVSLLVRFRGDWGTLRRKNSNPPNTDFIFKIKYFDDTYGYSIQWGIFEQEMKIIRNV